MEFWFLDCVNQYNHKYVFKINFIPKFSCLNDKNIFFSLVSVGVNELIFGEH